jgi:hypothetical protein
MSDRPMVVEAEVWPVAADKVGLWLLEPTGAWPCEPVADDREPHDDARLELIRKQAWSDTLALHSTSWRVEYNEDTDRNYLRVTYLAAIDCGGLVREAWPEAVAITTAAADAELGRVPTHSPVEAPAVRHFDVLFHALRHLRFLLVSDATVADALTGDWGEHLAAFEPAIARMYSQAHGAA